VLHTFVRPALLGVRFNMPLANVTSPQAVGLLQLRRARRRQRQLITFGCL